LMFNWAPPDGYPDRADYWVGLPLARWNFGASLLNGNIPDVSVDVAQFFGTAATPDAMANKINGKLFGGRMTPGERDLIRDYLATNPASDSVRRDAIGLALASPTFQWH
jgi:hypothetical protein